MSIPHEHAVVLHLTPTEPGFELLLDSVADIAAALALPAVRNSSDDLHQWKRDGFLVSAYGRSKYAELAVGGRLYVAIANEKVVAFSVIYTPEQPADDGDAGTSFVRRHYGAVPIVKQIATAKGFERKGYAKLLNDHLAAQHPKLPVFAAIVEALSNLCVGFSKALRRKHFLVL